MAGLPLTYWHVAGDIIWRGEGKPQPIPADEARDARERLSQQARLAFRRGDRETSKACAALWLELTKALDALDLYQRAMRLEAWPAAIISGAA